MLDRGFVAGFGGDERSRLEAALEGAGDDDVKLNFESVEDLGQLNAIALAVLVERALGVEERIGAAGASAGVPEDK